MTLPRTSDFDWELAQDHALDEMTEDQLVYLDRTVALVLADRGWIRDGDLWRLDV